MSEPSDLESMVAGFQDALQGGTDPLRYFAPDAVFVDAAGQKRKGYGSVQAHFEALSGNRMRFHHHQMEVTLDGDSARIRWRWDAVQPNRVLDAEISAERQDNGPWLMVIYSPFGHS